MPTLVQRKRDKNLKFTYQGDGKWLAISAMHDDGSHFEWKIRVTDEGRFVVIDSDEELRGTKALPRFVEFTKAVEWCDKEEGKMISDSINDSKTNKEEDDDD